MRSGSNPLRAGSGAEAAVPDASISPTTTFAGRVLVLSSRVAPSRYTIAPPTTAAPRAMTVTASGRTDRAYPPSPFSRENPPSGAGIGGEQKRHARARIAVQLELALHQLRELVRDRQPQATAGGARPVTAVEALEHLLTLLGWHARAVVDDLEGHAAAVRARADADARSRRRVHERVLEHGAADAQHLVGIGQRRHGAVGLDGEAAAAGPRRRLELAAEHLGGGVQVDRFGLDRQAPRVHARQIEQVGGHAREPRHLVAHRVQEVVARPLVDLLVLEQL